MGTLYRKFCPSCDRSDETNSTFDGFAGAALTDTGRGGEIVPEGYVGYIADNGELVPLPHPIESQALNAAGGTWNDAAIHGRLLYIHNLICADRGTQNTTASHHVGGTDCIAALVLASIVLTCNIFLFNLHSLIEIMFVCIAMLAPSTLIDRYVRFRYRANAVLHQNEHCDMCGNENLLSLATAQKSSLPCPRCSVGTMSVKIAGRS